MSKRVLVLPGDNIGSEIVAAAIKVLEAINRQRDLGIQLNWGVLGGAALDAHGNPCPQATLDSARDADAILLGAVGGPQWDHYARELRPESGLLRIRSELELFANLRPAIMYPQLAGASSLKPEVVAGLDILIVRELVGGIYFGEPRGIRTLDNGEREGYNTYKYSESEIRRIGKVAFEAAMVRDKRLCSIDKSNVLEATIVWKEVISEMASDYPEVELSHLYVDNAAMQLVRQPKQFDVLVTGNMFGDILSDTAAMLTGSIGMLPSASLGTPDPETGLPKAMYEPVHGSAPDIAGKGLANPLAQFLSFAMMLRYSFDQADEADLVEKAVNMALESKRTGDIMAPGCEQTGTDGMTKAVLDAMDRLAR